MLLLLTGAAQSVQAADNVLRDLNYSTLPGNQVEITLTLDKPVAQPHSFKTNQPARIAFDFMGTRSALAQRSVDIGIGAVNAVSTAQAGNRTRVVIELSQMVPYQTQVDGNTFHILLQPPTAMVAARPGADNSQADPPLTASENQITKIDFRRGPDGAGKIVVELSDASTIVDVRQEDDKLIADFLHTRVPAQLQRRLDVTDFATPVQTVDTTQRGGTARITVTSSGAYDQIAYQADNIFTVEIAPISKSDKKRGKQAFKYTGDRLSLNFQDIAVRSVLQLLADFTGINMVVSDSVAGNITLRLQNVPWDQALDIILKTKGLGKRRIGNVMLVAPAEEIAAREQLELKAKRQIQQLAPLQSTFIQVSYAKAQDLAQLILGSGKNGRSLLSNRGTVSVDQRTNTLIVQDTARNLDDIRRLVSKLDIPVRQVLIESRVVIANDDFSNELGVRFGYSRNQSNFGSTNHGGIVGGKLPGDVNFGQTTAYEVPAGSGNEGLLVDLPASPAAGAIGLAIGKIGSYLLQLELSAMETENRGDIISSPRVITTNQQEAYIKQGVQIPFQQATSSGATSVQFKEAVLGLTVTPQITPDDRILLDLQVTKDSPGQITAAGPAINTQSVSTHVLVDNGETVVLGGVYERTKNKTVTRVPFFGELPLVGWLFRNTARVNNNKELLIFVTPKILKQNLALTR
ncbi:MAG: type IV pilus secretin PilQ [Nitrococcus sp.]|nr:type IV pilus secretin PilQ [Nitrococcus sp.]